jgi:hypothetical protein
MIDAILSISPATSDATDISDTTVINSAQSGPKLILFQEKAFNPVIAWPITSV